MTSKSEEKIKIKIYMIEQNKTTNAFSSTCIQCKLNYVTPFDFKCVLIDVKNNANADNILPVCDTCHSKSQNTKYKTTIYKITQRIAYEKYYGRSHIQCFCCRHANITPFEYVCGHIKPKSHGGEYAVNNLRPICSLCNGSMGVQNMFHFMKTYLCIDACDDINDKIIIDNVREQQIIINDVCEHKEKSKYINYVLVKLNKSSRTIHIKNRINMVIKYVDDNSWTICDLLTNENYLKINIKNNRDFTCGYKLKNLNHDVKYGYIKFVKL
jgi:hypothetical protein